MTDFTLTCASCGDAIHHECAGATDANQTANGKVAQMFLGSTKDGRQPYNQDYPAQFLAFWAIYPRHRDKRKALKAWRNAIRRGAIDDINSGAIRYRDDPNRSDEFTKYAEGWLNGDGWLDEPLPARGQTPFDTEQARQREADVAEAHRFIEEERRVRSQDPS